MAKAMEDLAFDYKEAEKTERESYQKSYLDTSIRRPPTRSGEVEAEEAGYHTPPATSRRMDEVSSKKELK